MDIQEFPSKALAKEFAKSIHPFAARAVRLYTSGLGKPLDAWCVVVRPGERYLRQDGSVR